MQPWFLNLTSMYWKYLRACLCVHAYKEEFLPFLLFCFFGKHRLVHTLSIMWLQLVYKHRDETYRIVYKIKIGSWSDQYIRQPWLLSLHCPKRSAFCYSSSLYVYIHSPILKAKVFFFFVALNLMTKDSNTTQEVTCI